MRKKHIICFAVILSLCCFVLAACKEADPVVVYQDDELVVSEKVKPLKGAEPYTALKNMEYTIDFIGEESKEKVVTLKLAFDYSYSPEKGLSEIKNQSIETDYAKENWSVSTDMRGIIGNGTDLSAIRYYTSADHPDSQYIDADITFAADQNGKLTFARMHGYIDLDDETAEACNEHMAKFKDLKGGQQLVKTYDPVLLEGTDITYQVKEYQSEPFPLKGRTSNGKEVSDFSLKTARYDIDLLYGEEPVGYIRVENDQHLYTPSGNDVMIDPDAWGIIDSSAWRIERVRDEFNGFDLYKGETKLCMCEFAFNIKRVQENQEEQTVAKLKLALTADPEGKLTLKPIIVL